MEIFSLSAMKEVTYSYTYILFRLIEYNKVYKNKKEIFKKKKKEKRKSLISQPLK